MNHIAALPITFREEDMGTVLMTLVGSPQVLQVQKIENPAIPPRNTEFIVQLQAAGVNPIDTKLW